MLIKCKQHGLVNYVTDGTKRTCSQCFDETLARMLDPVKHINLTLDVRHYPKQTLVKIRTELYHVQKMIEDGEKRYQDNLKKKTVDN